MEKVSGMVSVAASLSGLLRLRYAARCSSISESMRSSRSGSPAVNLSNIGVLRSSASVFPACRFSSSLAASPLTATRTASPMSSKRMPVACGMHPGRRLSCSSSSIGGLSFAGSSRNSNGMFISSISSSSSGSGVPSANNSSSSSTETIFGYFSFSGAKVLASLTDFPFSFFWVFVAWSD